MHRSGTSLLSRILSQLGVFMGQDLHARTQESQFFQDLNRTIFVMAGAYWDRPSPVRELVGSRHQGRLIHFLSRTCCSPWIRLYLGRQQYSRHKSLCALDRLWGWKDPRNTYTLPLWLQVFPEAKVIHMFRNGVDVGQSLVRRAQKRPHLEQAPSSVSLSLPAAFDLWRQYVQVGLEVTAGLGPDRLLTLTYEGLLADPATQLTKLSAFLDSALSDQQAHILSSQLQSRRAYAFERDPDLTAFYQDVKSDPLMQALGYGEVDHEGISIRQ